MKKFLVIGNPINHSLSPKLHNYWLKLNNIKASYEKKKLNDEELENIILEVKNGNINGINVTVPFKNKVIKYLDSLTIESQKTQSVNTVYLENGKTIGHNTDIEGFTMSVKQLKFNLINKKVLILGAGGVVPSLILALNNMKVSEVIVSNRTRDKAENLKKLFGNIKTIEWGKISDFDMIINATSLGLKKEDKIYIEPTIIGKNKLFYDVIYNPTETNFLKMGKNLGNMSENGKLMFVYQAFFAFKIWHNIEPKINNELIKFMEK